VKRDFAEAARWRGCPKPSEEINASCRVISYVDLPDEVSDLLNKAGCDVGLGDVYDYGSAVDLSGNGVEAYQFCCHSHSHGPCGALLVGKVGTEWKALTEMAGYGGACTDFLILESQHRGFHDICVGTCASTKAATPNACSALIIQFNGEKFSEAASTSAKPAK
jgi:hypothetical protein